MAVLDSFLEKQTLGPLLKTVIYLLFLPETVISVEGRVGRQIFILISFMLQFVEFQVDVFVFFF